MEISFWKIFFSRLIEVFINFYTNKEQNICTHCNKSFKWKSLLEHHIKIVHEGVRVKCNYCVKTYTDVNTLKEHVNAVHQKVKIHCTLCDSTFGRPAGLRWHMKKFHEGGKPFIRKRQPNKSDSSHRSSVIKAKARAKFSCEFCGRAYESKALKMQHMRNVHRRDIY